MDKTSFLERVPELLKLDEVFVRVRPGGFGQLAWILMLKTENITPTFTKFMEAS